MTVSLDIDPDAERVIRQAVREWALRGHSQLSPAETIRRIRAEQSENSTAGMRVWTARNAVKPFRARRVATAVAALLLGSITVWIYIHGTKTNRNNADRPSVPVALTTDAANSHKAPRTIAARVVAGGAELFVRDVLTPVPLSWQSLGDQGCPLSGQLVQTALPAGHAELKLTGGQTVKLFPGTLLRLEVTPAGPVVDLWRGKVEVHAGNKALFVGTLAPLEQGQAVGEGPRARKQLAILASDHGLIAEVADAAVPVIEIAGQRLIDDRGLRPRECRVTRFLDDRPAVQLQPGAERLLRVISCQYGSKTVEEIVTLLGKALEIQIQLSSAAREKTGAKSVTLELGEVTGAEALEALKEKAGLVMKIEDGAVQLELPNEPRPATPEF